MKKIPKEIAKLRNLKVLNITYHQLSSLPDEICELEKLEEIFITDGAYDYLITLPQNIGNLKKLKKLKIGKVKALPASIGDLENLEILDCFLEPHSVPKEIANLHNLQYLCIRFDKACEFPIECICNMTKLETLDICGGTFKALPACIKNLVNLWRINLEDTGVEKIPSEISHLKLLEELVVTGNKLTSTPEGIRELKKLVKMDLSYNNFELE
ncbi:leucine-rich repeat domain-containing protein [Helicobacter saguini]|nr:hypothetical protein [Helicobacter saguini]MWV69081.1 hypothetical protein [Helicobacter saguini]